MCEHPLRKRRSVVQPEMATHAVDRQDAALEAPLQLVPDMSAVEYDQALSQQDAWVEQVVSEGNVEGQWTGGSPGAARSMPVADANLSTDMVSGPMYTSNRDYGDLANFSQSLNWLPFDVMDDSLAFGLVNPMSAFSTIPQRMTVGEPNTMLSYTDGQIFPAVSASVGSMDINGDPRSAEASAVHSSHSENTVSPSAASGKNYTRSELASDATYLSYAAGLGARSTRYDAKVARKRHHRLRSQSVSRRTITSVSSQSPNDSTEHNHDLARHLDEANVKAYMTEQQHTKALQRYQQSMRGRTLATAQHSMPLPFPSQRLLNKHISLYLDHFHPNYPFLDLQKLARYEMGWPLLIVMAAIGAIYSTPKSARGYGEMLHGFVRTYLMGVYSNGEPGETLEYAQTKALNIVGLCHASKKALVQQGYMERDLLVGTCHRLALLERINAPKFTYDVMPSESNWMDWRKWEERLRTGLFVWVRDFLPFYYIGPCSGCPQTRV